MKGFPDLPPIWWALSIGLIYLGNWALPGFSFATPLLGMASWVLLILALGIIGWSALWFYRKKTPIEPHHRPRQLIVEGPYRLSRNPIYLALVLLTLSSALGHGSLIGLVAAAGLWWVLDRRFAGPEERLLKDMFGDAADTYLTRTRRWI